MEKLSQKEIVSTLQHGGIGVLPTDTLYGVVGSALSKKAVARIYTMRNRDPKKPLIILIHSISDLALFDIVLTSKEKKTLAGIWPGKVSVILPVCPSSRFVKEHSDLQQNAVQGGRRPSRKKRLATSSSPARPQDESRLPCARKRFTYLHRGTNMLAFRVPADAKLRMLLKKTGPLVAPSANREGTPPARMIGDALRYFGEHVDFYSDGGKCGGKPSTLIAFENGVPVIKRIGAVRIKTIMI